MLLVLVACKGEPLDAEWCADGVAEPAAADGELTYWRDVKPILDQKCAFCHFDGGSAPFSVATYDDVQPWALDIAREVTARRMPPYLASSCCQTYERQWSLTDDEIGTIAGWAAREAPEGDTGDVGEARAPLGGLSRTDLTLEMPEPYTPDPPEGAIDELRCFLLDWPEDETRFITGLSPRPGARAEVHHLIVARTDEDGAAAAAALDAEDDRPGWECSGGTGDLGLVLPLGGSLVGGDYPRGLGTKIEPGTSIVLQVHYSLASGVSAEPDRTALDLRLDDDAVDASGIAMANLAWMVGEGMVIPAGEADVGYWYRFRPTLYTRGKPVLLQGVTPHMHRYGSRFRVLAVHPDGSETCLLEIPDWQFGWEQPYWLAEPVAFAPDDELYLECRFDNSAANQYGGAEPRDIAWGDSDQDMCAAFLSFTADE